MLLTILTKIRSTYDASQVNLNFVKNVTNCCESINSGLNKNCPALRTPNSVFNKVLKHKRGFLNKYSWVVELNNLSTVRRRKKVTAKYETLQDLCEAFDNFSEPERKLNLFKYLGLFSRRDAIPDHYDTMRIMMILKLYLHPSKKFSIKISM